jgi:hypothetical protein
MRATVDLANRRSLTANQFMNLVIRSDKSRCYFNRVLALENVLTCAVIANGQRPLLEVALWVVTKNPCKAYVRKELDLRHVASSNFVPPQDLMRLISAKCICWLQQAYIWTCMHDSGRMYSSDWALRQADKDRIYLLLSPFQTRGLGYFPIRLAPSCMMCIMKIRVSHGFSSQQKGPAPRGDPPC